MEVTYIIVISLITYCLGAVTKVFVEQIPSKFIPLQNVVIGLTSGLICFFAGLEANLLSSIVLCLMAAMGAGGIADLSKINASEKISEIV